MSVSVAELRLGWAAIAAARNAPASAALAGGPETLDSDRWLPAHGEHVLPVVGAEPRTGATTVALVLADAAPAAARLVECGPGMTSGVVGAGDRELGAPGNGWCRAARGETHLDRLADPPATSGRVPVPAPHPAGSGWTVLDAGPVGSLSGWVAEQVDQAPVVVLVAAWSVPGLRAVEAALTARPRLAEVGVLVWNGPPWRRWPRPLAASAGERTVGLLASGRCVPVRPDRRVAVTGLTPEPSSAAARAAAALIWKLVKGIRP